MDIRSDRQKGLSYVELGKKYHMDPRTAKRYAESPQKPEYTLTGPKPTKLDAYKQQIDSTLLGGTDSGKAAGYGICWRVQYRKGVCEQPKNGFEREGNGAVRDNAGEAGANGLGLL